MLPLGRNGEDSVYATFRHLSAVYPLGQRQWTMFNKNCYVVNFLNYSSLKN
jgi:hypothetical protein